MKGTIKMNHEQLETMKKMLRIMESMDKRLSEMENKVNFYCAYSAGDKNEIRQLRQSLNQMHEYV